MIAVTAASLLVAVGVAACDDDGGSAESNGATETTASSDLPQGSEPVELNPADFTTEIDNPYWPMTVGSRWIYRETTEEGTVQRVVVTVTDETKQVANGVEARVVHDVVSEDGEPVEITDDWYAQDSEGNIWYMGEATAEYENGKLATRAGSFEAGVDGAQPGVIMPADPQPGLAYRQEYLKGEAEDFGSVLSLDEQVEVPFGSFDGALQTRDVDPLEKPKAVEHKFYARGLGPVLAFDTKGGDREELLSFESGE
jgi:hypothetical protein